MQATQSSTAWESGDRSGQFAALRHVTRTMWLVDEDAAPVVDGRAGLGVAEAGAGGVAEGAGLAHDVGNLLGALSLYSDLLALPGVLSEEHRQYAAELRLLSERSWAMVTRLMNHVQVERPAKADVASTVLPEVVERCKGLLSKVAGQAVEVRYGGGAFEPVGVPVEAVERILTNLVKNAAEATPHVGAVAVNVEGVIGCDARRRVVLTVRDKGCGMDPATVRGLMQAGGISSVGGRGLGFRVVTELAAMSGGCLNIESQVGTGTSVSVEWYVLEDCEQESAMRGDMRLKAC